MLYNYPSKKMCFASRIWLTWKNRTLSDVPMWWSIIDVLGASKSPENAFKIQFRWYKAVQNSQSNATNHVSSQLITSRYKSATWWSIMVVLDASKSPEKCILDTIYIWYKTVQNSQSNATYFLLLSPSWSPPDTNPQHDGRLSSSWVHLKALKNVFKIQFRWYKMVQNSQSNATNRVFSSQLITSRHNFPTWWVLIVILGASKSPEKCVLDTI